MRSIGAISHGGVAPSIVLRSGCGRALCRIQYDAAGIEELPSFLDSESQIHYAAKEKITHGQEGFQLKTSRQRAR